MKTKTVIECSTDDLEFGYFDENDNYETTSPSKFAEDAKYLGVSVAMVKALHFFVEFLSENLHSDLADIWERLDDLEG